MASPWIITPEMEPMIRTMLIKALESQNAMLLDIAARNEKRGIVDTQLVAILNKRHIKTPIAETAALDKPAMVSVQPIPATEASTPTTPNLDSTSAEDTTVITGSPSTIDVPADFQNSASVAGKVHFNFNLVLPTLLMTFQRNNLNLAAPLFAGMLPLTLQTAGVAFYPFDPGGNC
jgi:hypothetical protein